MFAGPKETIMSGRIICQLIRIFGEYELCIAEKPEFAYKKVFCDSENRSFDLFYAIGAITLIDIIIF